MMEMQLLMDETYPPYIHCHGIENLSDLFAKIDVLYLLKAVKRPLPIVQNE